MTAADRAKAAEPPKGVSPDLYAAALLTNDWEASDLGIANLRDRIAAALAAARADADAHWKAKVEGLAEEIARGGLDVHNPSTDAAARLRGLVTGNSEEGQA